MSNFLKYNKCEFDFNSYFLRYQDLKIYSKIIQSQSKAFIPVSISNNLSKMFNICKVSDIKRKFGKPSNKSVSKLIKTHNILFYRYKQKDHNLLRSFHFINNKLIMINFTFQDIINRKNFKINELILENFSVYTEMGDEMKLTDTSNNIIFIENMFEISFSIMSSDRKDIEQMIKKFRSNEITKNRYNKFPILQYLNSIILL